MTLSKIVKFLLTAQFSALAAASDPSTTVLRKLRSRRPITAAASPEREKTCLVDSHGDLTTDDSKYVLSAFDECNDGGRKQQYFAYEGMMLMYYRCSISTEHGIHYWRPSRPQQFVTR